MNPSSPEWSGWPVKPTTPVGGTRFNDVLPGWFQSYLGLEASASLIRTYEISLFRACCRHVITHVRS